MDRKTDDRTFERTCESALKFTRQWMAEVPVARITIEDCLKRVDNRFKLVHMAAARVRQIREGSEYLVSSPKNEDIVVALREVAAGKVVPSKHLLEKA
jgi:DNA-directed RNA polymerase subunit omega